MKSTGEVFDISLFWEHVKEYMKRRNLTAGALAVLCDTNSSNLCTAVKHQKSPSLELAIKLSYVCDLDLNKYIKTEWYYQ